MHGVTIYECSTFIEGMEDKTDELQMEHLRLECKGKFLKTKVGLSLSCQWKLWNP